MTCDNRKQDAANRRDFRNAKTPESDKLASAKKNTKKWCKGKVGVKHDPVCTPWNTTILVSDARILACSKCGKHLDYYLPWPKQKPKPSWWK